MKTKVADRKRVRGTVITFPVNEYEKTKIIAEADRRGLSMAAFVRDIIADYFKKEGK